MLISNHLLKFEHVPKRTMRWLSFPGPALPSENRSVQGDYLHFCAQSFGLGPKSPLSQSLHANHSGGEMPLGRMNWSRTDFWLAVEAGKNRSSTTTSPCTPYPLPSELQGDKVGKDYLLQNLHLDMRTGLSNCQPHTVLEEAQNDVHEHKLFP